MALAPHVHRRGDPTLIGGVAAEKVGLIEGTTAPVRMPDGWSEW